MNRTFVLLKQVTLFIALSTLAFGFQSCTEVSKEIEQTVPEFDLTTAKAEIEAANANFMSLVAAGDSVGIANLYTTDAKVMFTGAPSAVGRANIQTVFAGIINSGVTRVNLETKEVFGSEDLLVEEGEGTIYVQDVAVAVDKYIVIWKKVDGEWKLFRDITNSNSPAE